MNKVSSALVALLAIGCALPDDPASHRCRADEECTAGRVCVAGLCAAIRPDAAMDTLAPVPDGAPADAPSITDATTDLTASCDACTATLPPQIAAAEALTCLRTADLRIICWGTTPGLAPARGLEVAVGLPGQCVIRENGTIGCGWSTSMPPEGTFAHLSVGEMMSCGVRTEGTLVCWLYGQYLEPVYSLDLSPPGTYTAVAVNAVGPQVDDKRIAAICAIRTDGTLACWATDDAHLPEAPAGKFQQVAVGTGQACGLREDGALLCWGAVTLTEPGPFTALTIGGDRLCAITTAGAVRCWDPKGAPLPEVAGPFTALAAGARHVCAVRPGGAVSCWGDNSLWQTGPPRGPFLAFDVVQQYGCAVKLDHSLACWGQGDANMSPLRPPPEGKFTAVQIGGANYACALRDDQTIACWGDNPDMLPPPNGTFQALSLPCALRTDGTVACWMAGVKPPEGVFSQFVSYGTSFCGLRSDHTIDCESQGNGPAPRPPAGEFTSMVLGDGTVDAVCGLRADGSVACNGCMEGTGPRVCGFPIPAASIPRGPFRRIGNHHECLCGLTADDVLECWSPFLDADCRAIETRDGKALDFSSLCLVSTTGALLCDGQSISVDLEHP